MRSRSAARERRLRTGSGGTFAQLGVGLCRADEIPRRLRQELTFSRQSAARVQSLFLRRRGDDQVLHSIELAPPAKFRAEPSNGLTKAPPAVLPATSAANLQPVERGVTRRPAALAQSPFARGARPEMAPQAIENPRFAPENGAPAPPRARSGDRGRRARNPRTRSGGRDEGKPAVRRADRNARRPQMAPQAIEKLRFAPENGAPFTLDLRAQRAPVSR